MPKTINITLNEKDFQKLKEIKNNRSWEQALKEEFGINENGEEK